MYEALCSGIYPVFRDNEQTRVTEVRTGDLNFGGKVAPLVWPRLKDSASIFAKRVNSYPSQLVTKSTRTQNIVPESTRTQVNSYPKYCTQVNSYPSQLVPKILYPSQLVPKSTRSQVNSYTGQLVPQSTRT